MQRSLLARHRGAVPSHGLALWRGCLCAPARHAQGAPLPPQQMLSWESWLSQETSWARDPVCGAVTARPTASFHSFPYRCFFCTVHRGVGGHRGVGDCLVLWKTQSSPSVKETPTSRSQALHPFLSHGTVQRDLREASVTLWLGCGCQSVTGCPRQGPFATSDRAAQQAGQRQQATAAALWTDVTTAFPSPFQPCCM